MAPCKCDIRGVDYEKKYLQDMDQVSIKMAGALGLKDTAVLWDLFLNDSATRPILEAWLDMRQRTFGTTLKHAHMTLRPTIVNLAFDTRLQPIMLSPNQPAIGTNGVDEKSLATFTCLWLSFKLLKAKPNLFNRSQLDGSLVHIDPYDITHAYKLLSWIYRKQKGSKIPAGKPHKALPSKPVFFHEGLGATTAAGPSRAIEHLFGLTSHETMWAMDNAEAVATAEFDEDAIGTIKLDVVGELTDAIYPELRPVRQFAIPRPCVPIDRQNILLHLMEVDQFERQCIIRYTNSIPATTSTTAVTCAKLPLNAETVMCNGANTVLAIDGKFKATRSQQSSLSCPNPPLPLKLAYILGNSTMGVSDIPPCEINTVELVNPKRIQTLHDKRYKHLIQDFQPITESADQYATSDPGDGSHSHRCALRRLCMLAFSTRLDQFVSRLNAKHDLIDQLRRLGDKEDRGFALYYACTTQDPAVPMPTSPLLQASYLAMEAPKLRMLLKILHDEGAFDATVSLRPRFVILAHWQPVLWLTEMFLNSLGIPFVTVWLSPSMKATERKKAIKSFMAAKKPCQILLTNFNCKAKALNLHTVCSRMVVLEPPLNMGRMLEAIGSIHRPGQKQQQKVWLLFQNHTFNRWMEANNTLNILSWITTKINKHRSDGAKACDKAIVERELAGLLGRSCNVSDFVNYHDLYGGTSAYAPVVAGKRKGSSSDSSRPKKQTKK